ncbi:hypothetical protein [Rhizohabitans arisaemae]|uniref:hypothetical protein n=1 Tax=Rhizohabitans arisaemae TaxID=2720610 RepID=UPI0024B1B6C9|nr:hypothetical protein [Rhizohabitans arisaemae]
MTDGGAGSARERLAARQAELLTALVAGGPPPEGFDPVRLRVQRDSLIAKRRGLVARAAPLLVHALDGEFVPLFAGYADGRPKPAGGSAADARAFTAWLEAAGRLPERAPAPAEEARPRWWKRRLRRGRVG